MGNIQQIPASVLASWPKPNYIDPQRRSWMPAFAMIWQVASSVLVWGRFYLRMRRLAGPFGYDDAFMLIAWMSSVTFTACAWVLTAHYGVDRHTWDVNVKLFSGAAMVSVPGLLIAVRLLTTMKKYAWILQVLMLVGSGATKASVLLFYRRLVTGTLARRWRYAIYFALVFHALYLVGITLGYVLICRPLQAYWLSYDFDWDGEYTCAPAAGLNPVIGVLSIVSDVYAVALPFIILHYYDLDVPRSQKIGLNIIFALGLLVAGAGVGRTYYLIKLGETYDTSWTGFDLLVWTIIELQLGIICACAPSLRAFFRRYLSGVFSRTFNSSSRSRTRTRSEGYRSTTDKHANSVRDKEAEAIDMQVLTERSSRDRTPEPPEMPARSVSPTYTFGSRSMKEARSGSHPARTDSQHSRQWPSTQDISTAIMKAQEIHSTV